MSRKYISFFLLCLLLTGCSGDGSGAAEAGQYKNNQKEELSPEDRTKETEYEEKAENIKSVQYPMLATPVSVDWIDTILVSEGRYCIYAKGKYGFMTEDGEEITSYIYDIAYPYHEGLACVSCDGKYGYIDWNGETVLPFIYDRATPFVEGLAYFAMGDTYGFMDQSGAPVFYLDCDSVSSFQEGLAYFSVDGRYGYMDQKGNTVIEPVYDDAGYFKDGFAQVIQNGRYGIIDRTGTEIIAPEYDAICFSDTFFIAEGEGSYDCFDSTGRKLLASCERISVKDGYLCFERDEKWGIADATGRILLEPRYGSVSPVKEKELVIVEEGDYYGILDFSGAVKVPFLYSWISYESGVENGVYHVSLDGKWGCLNGADFSEQIPVIYDHIGSFTNNRAIVLSDGQYGVIDGDGNLVFTVLYDTIRLFADNGAVWLEKNGTSWLLDERGKLLKTGDFGIYGIAGNGYKIEVDGKYGFLNEKGEEIIPAVYEFITDYKVYGSSYAYVLTDYQSDSRCSILKTGDDGDSDLSDAVLKNEITPRMGAFFDFVQGGSIKVDDVQVELKDLNGYRKTYKLYDINHSGNPVLYFNAEPYIYSNFPLSYSGFCDILDDQPVKLITGHECGGSLRGDYACLWYDRERDEVYLGKEGSWGGFGGRALEGTVYDYEVGKCPVLCSFELVSQSAGNYTEEKLLANAGWFYDEQENPYAQETILEAATVSEYFVNGEQTTVENYHEVRERYLYLSLLD